MNVVAAFLFLAWCTAKNKVLRFVRRLKNPRYLLSAVATIVYFIFVFGKNRALHTMFAPRTIDPAAHEVIALGLSLVVLAALIVPWTFPSGRAGLDFSESEIQFLFPAPLRRWQLLLYKIVRSQFQILISAFIFFLLSKTGRLSGIWFVIVALTVYFMMVRFARARLRQMGFGLLARLGTVLVIVAAICYALYVSFDAHAFVQLMRGGTGASAVKLLRVINESLHEPAWSLLQFPLVFAHAVVGESPHIALQYALVFLFAAACFLVMVRLDLSFEDASLEVSTKKSQQRELRDASRRGQRVMFRRMKAPFDLAGSGHPAVALFWKNLIAAGRVFSARLAMIVLASILPVTIIARTKAGDGSVFFTIAGILSLVLAGIFMILGPLSFRNDLRGDFPHFDLLKAMPIEAQELIAGEIAAPWLILCVVEFFFLFLGCVFLLVLSNQKDQWVSFAFASAAYVIAVPTIAISLLIQNGWVVVFPAWNLQSKEDARGFATSGSRMLLMFGHLVLMAIALVPAAIAFLSSFWALHFFIDSRGQLAFLAAIPAAAVLAAEAYFAVRLLANQFEQMDVANDLAPTG